MLPKKNKQESRPELLAKAKEYYQKIKDENKGQVSDYVITRWLNNTFKSEGSFSAANEANKKSLENVIRRLSNQNTIEELGEYIKVYVEHPARANKIIKERKEKAEPSKMEKGKEKAEPSEMEKGKEKAEPSGKDNTNNIEYSSTESTKMDKGKEKAEPSGKMDKGKVSEYLKKYEAIKYNQKKSSGKNKNLVEQLEEKYKNKLEKDTGAIVPPDTEHIGQVIAVANVEGIINNAQHLNSGDSKQTMNTNEVTQSDVTQLNNVNAFNANYGNNVQTEFLEQQLPTETNNVLTPGGIIKAPIISIRDNVEIIKQIQEETPAGKIWTERQEEELRKMFEPLLRQQNSNYRDQLKINHGISQDYVEKTLNASKGVLYDTRKMEPVNRNVDTMKMKGQFGASMDEYKF